MNIKNRNVKDNRTNGQYIQPTLFTHYFLPSGNAREVEVATLWDPLELYSVMINISSGKELD